MQEADDILLMSLRNAGCDIPDKVMMNTVGLATFVMLMLF